MREYISIEYWGKKRKRHCFTILIPKQNKCIQRKYISVVQWKMANT